MSLFAKELLQKGTIAYKKGLYKEAEENYKKTIELNPNLVVPYNNLGVLLKGDWESNWGALVSLPT